MVFVCVASEAEPRLGFSISRYTRTVEQTNSCQNTAERVRYLEADLAREDATCNEIICEYQLLQVFVQTSPASSLQYSVTPTSKYRKEIHLVGTLGEQALCDQFLIVPRNICSVT